MPRPTRRLASCQSALLAVLSGCGLLLAGVPGQAAEQPGGLDIFFRQMFGGPTQTAAAPAQVRTTGSWYSSGQRRRSYLHQTTRVHTGRRAHTRYAAAPAPEAQKGSQPKGPNGIVPLQDRAYLVDPAEALLRDPTLRRGDIVVLRQGPKVFTGMPQAVHRAADFEDAHHSKAISSDLRKRLAAMTTPVGALPAHEVRRRPSDLQTLRADPQTLNLRVTAKLGSSVAPVSPRVIYP